MPTLRACLLAGAGTLALAAATPAVASPTYAYQKTVAIPGASAATPFTGYDLSTIDPLTQLYYLTDRSFNGIDVFSVATGAFIEQIGHGLFAGNSTGSATAGPNGISITTLTGGGKLLLAGDGRSQVIAFNLAGNGTTVQGAARTFSTQVPAVTPIPANRVDGVAYAPAANTILAANNASNPGYLTLINNANGAIIKSLVLNGLNGTPNVGGNGVEATIYNTSTNTFFVGVPAFNAAGTGAGGVLEIDPVTGNILHTYDFNAMGLVGTCSPTGVAHGGGASMFVACSDNTAGKSIILDPLANSHAGL